MSLYSCPGFLRMHPACIRKHVPTVRVELYGIEECTGTKERRKLHRKRGIKQPDTLVLKLAAPSSSSRWVAAVLTMFVCQLDSKMLSRLHSASLSRDHRSLNEGKIVRYPAKKGRERVMRSTKDRRVIDCNKKIAGQLPLWKNRNKLFIVVSKLSDPSRFS